jgi:hypothetical protein
VVRSEGEKIPAGENKTGALTMPVFESKKKREERVKRENQERIKKQVNVISTIVTIGRIVGKIFFRV